MRLFNTPWSLIIDTNKGDCLKTKIISKNMKLKLILYFYKNPSLVFNRPKNGIYKTHFNTNEF